MNKWLIAIGLIAFFNLAHAGGQANIFRTLSVKQCTSPGSSSLMDKLSADWKPYAAAIKICPLLKQDGGKSKIVLVSIFSDDYYHNKPADSPWEPFPMPVLLNGDGVCIGRLPELFPHDQPRQLVLRYGQWQGDIPGEIRIHVRNPAIGGDYDLPVLIWNDGLQKYLTASSADACENKN